LILLQTLFYGFYTNSGQKKLLLVRYEI